MLGELQKPQALRTGKEVGVVKKLTSEGFTQLRSAVYFVSEGRDIFTGLSGYAACVDEFKHHQRASGVGFYSLGGHQNPGLAYGPFWVGLEFVSVYPEVSARDQWEGITPGLLGEESPRG